MTECLILIILGDDHILHDLFRCPLSSPSCSLVVTYFITRSWNQLRVEGCQASAEQQESNQTGENYNLTWHGGGTRNWKAGGLGSGPSSVTNSFIHSFTLSTTDIKHCHVQALF